MITSSLRPRAIALLALLLLFPAVPGCAPRGGAGLEEYAGIYEHGFEVDVFRPCGSAQEWWVSGGEELRRRYAEAVGRDYQPVYVVVRGRVSEPGRYGQLGRYERQIEVEELVAIDARREACPGPQVEEPPLPPAPPSRGDGFGPRAEVILEEWRWGSGAGMAAGDRGCPAPPAPRCGG